MRYCEKCRVYVRGDTNACPLCHNAFVDGEAETIYPQIPTIYSQNSLFFKIFMLCSIAAAVLCVGLNLILGAETFWASFVLLGIACVWLLLYAAIRKRHNMLKNVMYQAVLLIIISVLWDNFTSWRGWSVTYVLPTVWVCAMAALTILNRFMHLHIFEQLVYLVMLAVFGILPLIFILTNVVTTAIPSIISIILSIVSLAALIIFKGKELKSEMKRRLHL